MIRTQTVATTMGRALLFFLVTIPDRRRPPSLVTFAVGWLFVVTRLEDEVLRLTPQRGQARRSCSGVAVRRNLPPQLLQTMTLTCNPFHD